LGFGGEVSYRVSDYFGVRLGGNYFRLTRTSTIKQITYDLTPRLESWIGMVDIHPFRSAFHFTGGALYDENQARMVARLNAPVTIGDQTYQPDQVGSLTGVVEYPREIAPYLGLGFTGRGRVSLVFDLGVLFSGYPKATLIGTTNLTGQAKATFDENVQKEQDKVQTDIHKEKVLKYYPLLSLGLRVGF